MLLVAGCSRNQSERLAVQGRVTYQGNPIQEGTILFEPIDEGRQANGVIAAGRFSIPSSHGLSEGDYRVEIEAYQKASASPSDGPGALYAQGESAVEILTEQYLPAKYNRQSNLTQRVSRENHNSLEFPLE